MNISRVKDSNILFLDIETAPMQALVDQSDEAMCHLWNDKMAKMAALSTGETTDDQTPEEHIQQAGLYAEFGRIVCISFGAYYPDKTDGSQRFCVSSFFGTDEKKIVESFSNMLVQKKMTIDKLCGHNAKEFDIPFIVRRMLILGVQVPDLLKVYDKKPWEVPVIDTMEMWKCGAYRYSAQLKLLCQVLGIPSPKDDIDGSEVAGVFYNEKDYNRIATYCQKDVIATMQVHRRITGQNIMQKELITEIPHEPLV